MTFKMFNCDVQEEFTLFLDKRLLFTSVRLPTKFLVSKICNIKFTLVNTTGTGIEFDEKGETVFAYPNNMSSLFETAFIKYSYKGQERYLKFNVDRPCGSTILPLLGRNLKLYTLYQVNLIGKEASYVTNVAEAELKTFYNYFPRRYRKVDCPITKKLFGVYGPATALLNLLIPVPVINNQLDYVDLTEFTEATFKVRPGFGFKSTITLQVDDEDASIKIEFDLEVCTDLNRYVYYCEQYIKDYPIIEPVVNTTQN